MAYSTLLFGSVTCLTVLNIKTKLGLLGLPLDTQPRQDMENLVHDLVRAQHAHSIQAEQRPGFLPVCAAGETAAWQCVSWS